jgi:sugar lactone lactonase YvrE
MEILQEGINKPLGVAVNINGNVYVANGGASDVTVYNIEGKLVGKLMQDVSGFRFVALGALAIHGSDLFIGLGSGENTVVSYHLDDFVSGSPKPITTIASKLNAGPTGIAFDRAGNVYVSDLYSGNASKYSPTGGESLLVINEGTGFCEGIAVDGIGNLFVANGDPLNKITVYSPEGKLIRTLQ